MASLRKRLGNAGIDLSSPKLNESFVLIGTPLPPLESLKDKNEFVPLWKQEVRDEQGRRRLHGAFTGGFSAGYFNTVGSKEGWTPSTFKSSRNDRSKNKAMKPEDFMDEEDLAEIRENRKLVDSDEVGNLIEGYGQSNEEDDSFAAALANMLPPINESVGAQLLKRMGWKPGQGIGPRLTYEQMKRRNEREGLTILVPEDAEATKHTYAPQDRQLPSLTRKDNFHGLGYTGVTGLRSAVDSKGASSGPRLSTGFGLGALNDADDDDVDIYDDARSRTNRRLAYDPSEADTDSKISNLPHSGKSHGSKGQTTGFFKNGVHLLGGFVIKEAPVSPPQRFDPLQVPDDWKPDPSRIWDLRSDIQQSMNSSALGAGSSSASHQQWKAGISANERGALLGETPLPPTKRSVWDYMSEKNKERLQNYKTNPSLKNPLEAQSMPVIAVGIPRTDPAVAKAALLGFQPFKNEPLKQARYTAYLNSQASSQSVPLQPLSGQSITDFNSELESFAKAAHIFKPMSTAMASRFRSSSSVETAPNQQEGLYQPTEEVYAEHEQKQGQEALKKAEVQESPKENAAKMGLFGRLTREESDWAPARLLCKRFRVAPPKLSTSETREDEPDQAPSIPVVPSSLGTPMELDPNPGGAGFTVVATMDKEDSNRKKDLANIGLGEDDTQGQDILTYQRPEMDIFKAIFASDEEDSDSDVEFVSSAPQPPPITHGSNLEAPAGSMGLKPSGSLDLATFRPTFISRSNREGKKTDATAESSQKLSSKKTKARPSLSFVDDDEGGLTVVPATKKRKKEKDSKGRSAKNKKEKEVNNHAAETTTKMMVDDEDDEMWVEKEVPPTVLNLPQDTPASNLSTTEDSSARVIGRARPRASDFL